MFMSKSLEKFEEGTYEDSLDLDVNVVVLQAIPPWKWLKTLLVIGMIFLWPVYLVLVTIVLVIMLVFWYIPTEVWTNGKKISRLLRR